MNKSFSNIAWTKEEDENIFLILKEYGFKGLEIAPTRIWDNPLKVNKSDLKSYKKKMSDKGLPIVAVQALLFGQPEKTIFEKPDLRKNTIDYLKMIIIFASEIGAQSLVFGSPKNRVIGSLDKKKAEFIAIDFFSELGDFAKNQNTTLCIEPNPRQYNTDFINTTSEALELVKKVNNKGFQLHIDTGAILINKSPLNILEEASSYIAHYHISEPWLKLISEKNRIFHMEAASLLRDINYKNWVSVEMRKNILKSNPDAVRITSEFVSDIY